MLYIDSYTFKPGDLRHHVNPLVVIDLDLLPVGDDVIAADGKVVQEGAAQGEAVIQEFTYRVETAASEKKIMVTDLCDAFILVKSYLFLVSLLVFFPDL